MPTWCNIVIYWSFLSSTCFGRISPSSGALDVKLQHMVFCTQFVDGWWSWYPLCRSCVWFGWCQLHGTIRTVRTTYAEDLRTTTHLQRVQKTICCKLTSSAPDDGRMCPKHIELRIRQYFTMLHQFDLSLYFKDSTFSCQWNTCL